MAIYRYRWKDLREFAKGNDTVFRKKPKGATWDELDEKEVVVIRKGTLKLVSRKPIVVSYGRYTYTLAKDFLEIEIPDSVIRGVDTERAPLYVFTGFRLASFAGTMQMVDNIKKTFVIKKHHIWKSGEVVPISRKIRDTDTLSEFPSYTLITYPYLPQIVRYLYFRPRTFTISTATTALAPVYKISKSESREHLDRAFSLDYLTLEEIETYPKRYWSLLVVKAVSEAEGVYSFTALRRELTKYGISFRETFDLVFSALDENWVDEVKGRYVTTDAGKIALEALPSPKVRRLIVVSKVGREFIGM